MKWILCSALLTGLSTWGTNFAAAACGEEVQPAKVVVQPVAGQVFLATTPSADGTGAAAGAAVFEVEVTDNGEGPVKVVRRIGKGDVPPGQFTWTAASGREPANLMIAQGEPSPDSGWLGIQFGIFNESETGKETESGVKVINVAKDSPAAAAGFQQNDVIIEINDTPVSDDLGALVEQIREADPGQRVKFTVSRDGVHHTLAATLARRGDVGEITWMFEGGEWQMHDALKTRVKMLRRGEDGEWEFGGVDGGVLNVLPHNIGDMMGSHSVKVFATRDGGQTEVTVMRDGDTTVVKTDESGAITVTQTDGETGEETVKTYATADELAAADAEAFRIYENADSHTVIDLGDDAQSATAHTFMFHALNDENGDADGDDTFDIWISDLEDRVKDSSESLAETMEQLKNIRVRVNGGDEGGDDVHGHLFQMFHGKAQRTIRENPDGTIDVIVRKGGDELATRYTNAADLQARNPDAYAKYVELQSPDE